MGLTAARHLTLHTPKRTTTPYLTLHGWKPTGRSLNTRAGFRPTCPLLTTHPRPPTCHALALLGDASTTLADERINQGRGTATTAGSPPRSGSGRPTRPATSSPASRQGFASDHAPQPILGRLPGHADRRRVLWASSESEKKRLENFRKRLRACAARRPGREWGNRELARGS